MAKNTGNGHRSGSVNGRTQVETPTGWAKRDVETGRFIDNKRDEPFKGVAKEPDGRRR